jgi:MFS family permease
MTPTPRSSGYFRIGEATGLAGYNFLAMVRRGFFYTFLMVYLREVLGQPVTLISLIGATNAVMSTLGQTLVWGKLSDRTDRRAGLMILGEVIGGVGYLLTFAVFRGTLGAVSPGVTTLLLIACLGATEFFWSMTDVGYRSAIAQVTTAGNRGRFLGVIDFTGLIGLGLGLLLAGELYDGGRGFENGHLWFLAAGFILAGVPLIRATLSHLDGVRGPGAEEEATAPLSPAFLRFMLVLGVAVLGLWCFQQNHTFFIRQADTAAVTDRELSLVRTAFWVVAGLVAPLSGWWIDRTGARRAYLISLLAGSLVPVTFLLTRSAVYAAVSLAAYGAVLTAVRNSSYAWAAELTPERGRGRHFALYNAVMSAGWGLAALLIGGPVADLLIARGRTETEGFGASFVVGAALGLLGFGLAFRIRRDGGPPPREGTPPSA